MSYIKEKISVMEAAIDYVRHGVSVMPAWNVAGKWCWTSAKWDGFGNREIRLV